MRVLFWMVVAAYVAAWCWAAATLPGRVPVRFDLNGVPARWGSSTELLTAMALLGGGLAVLLGGLSWFSGRLPLRAAWVNLPHKQWWLATPEREARARRMIVHDLHALSSLVMAIPLGVLVLTAHAADQPAPRMSSLAQVLICAALVLVLGWSAWLALARYRPRDDG
ncbi:DUF1648 domain-containing protein [Saccharopolyspora sp. MS10]|uniref:DUF1648 domain-containing protein n=1 Tax=Saccharopolyspora sp. MS10 TaxID=3385973 RepID=UPI0039A33772